MIKTALTQIKCSIKPASTSSHRSLKNELQNLSKGVESLKASNFAIIKAVNGTDTTTVSVGGDLEIDINLAESKSFSFGSFFSLKRQRQFPKLEKFVDEATGLSLESTPDSSQDCVSINVSHSLPSADSKVRKIRETVMPTSSALNEYFLSQQWIGRKQYPGVFWYSSQETSQVPPYRTIPGVQPTFIIYSKQFDDVREALASQSLLRFEDMIGSIVEDENGNYNREKLLDLVSFQQFGFSVRITNHQHLTRFFVHGPESVLENTIQSIQSVRVFGGPSSLVENKFGYSGDCWSEVKAMGSSVVGKAMKGDVHSITATSRGHQKKLISREPSIIE